MNLLSKNNLIRLIIAIGVISSIRVVFLTNDNFYYIFVLIAGAAFGTTFFKKNLEYKLKTPELKITKSIHLSRLLSKNLRWVFCGLAMLLCIIVFTSTGIVGTVNEYFKDTYQQEFQSADNSGLNTQENSNDTFPTNTPYPTLQPTKVHINPDPIVDCGPGKYSGQYVKDKRSNCQNYVDCGLNNDTIWTLMLKTECDKKHAEQTANSNNNSSAGNNKVPVFLSYYGYTVQCPAQNSQAVQDINSSMEDKKSGWNDHYNSCTDSFWNTDACYVSCKNGPIDNYGDCIKSCPSAYDHCKYAYEMADIYKSQIDNLCK